MGAASASTGPVTAGVPDDLAGLYRATGRHAAAAPLFRRAVAILGTSLPADHPTLTRVREGTVKLSSKGMERRRSSLELRTYAAALAPVIPAQIANACART